MGQLEPVPPWAVRQQGPQPLLQCPNTISPPTQIAPKTPFPPQFRLSHQCPHNPLPPPLPSHPWLPGPLFAVAQPSGQPACAHHWGRWSRSQPACVLHWGRWSRNRSGLCGPKVPSPPSNSHSQFFHSHKLPPKNHFLPNLDSPTPPFDCTMYKPSHFPPTPGYLESNLPSHSPAASLPVSSTGTDGAGVSLPVSTAGAYGAGTALGCVAPRSPAPPSFLTQNFSTPTNCPQKTISSPISTLPPPI